jgi:ABC-type nitrate/sulfonate/bicarbonate transport system substrate-binding protein
VTYLPNQIALVMGYYREAGFDAEIQVMLQTALLASVAAGEIPFGDSGGSGIRAAATGLPVRLVDCHGIRALYSVALAPGLHAARDLEGKPFAINTIGDDTQVTARVLISNHGGDPDQVEYFAIGASSVRYSAVASGRVGGAILSSTEIVQAQDAGLTMVGEAEEVPLACNSGIVVPLASIADRAPSIGRYVAAVHKAVRLMQSDRATSTRILAEWQEVDQRAAERAYDATRVDVTSSTDRAAGQQAIENALELAKQAGQVAPEVTIRDVADLRYYP